MASVQYRRSSELGSLMSMCIRATQSVRMEQGFCLRLVTRGRNIGFSTSDPADEMVGPPLCLLSVSGLAKHAVRC